MSLVHPKNAILSFEKYDPQSEEITAIVLNGEDETVKISLYLEAFSGVDYPILLFSHLPRKVVKNDNLIEIGRLSSLVISVYGIAPSPSEVKLIVESIEAEVGGQVFRLTFDEFSDNLDAFKMEIIDR